METKRVSFDIPWASYNPDATNPALPDAGGSAIDWNKVAQNVAKAAPAAAAGAGQRALQQRQQQLHELLPVLRPRRGAARQAGGCCRRAAHGSGKTPPQRLGPHLLHAAVEAQALGEGGGVGALAHTGLQLPEQRPARAARRREHANPASFRREAGARARAPSAAHRSSRSGVEAASTAGSAA